MATPWGLTCLFIGLNILQICNAHPKDQLPSGSEGPNGQVMGVLVAVMVSVCAVFVLVACVCCKRRSGFKENEHENEKKVFRNSPVSASVINETSLSGDDPGHVNPIANAEFTIFTPLSPPHHNNNVFRSQPPVICYTENETAPELNKAVNPQIGGIEGIDVSAWFADTEYDFPRSRLKYIRELGTGWFGRVVEGEALAISSEATSPDPPTWTPVAVRILESSASAHEQAQFLHEAAMYRTGAHPNLLQLLGRSLEATPLLLIHEFCSKGDLKNFLLENRECKDSEVMGGVPLRFCCQLAAALEYLHENNMPHLDLAARTCQISSDLNLKLGDYGLAVTQYPNDYYQGTPSIPVRWCAPESVNHTNTTLQPKKITLAANVWSLAVAFWEICEWGRLPYDWLTDDEVVSQVMGTPHIRLPQPSLNAYYIPPLYRLMKYCWLPDQNRPQIHQIYSMLVHLTKTYSSSPSSQPETNDFSTENFDLRWESFKPNTIIKTDNARTKSASLTNLHGSFENLADGINDTVIQMDSWLENVASHTDDMQYVRGLSEAIHELDTALASEKTSSSSSFDQTPNSSLGPARSDTVIHMDDSSNLDSLFYLPKRSESGSETEDETWRKRIERGAYSEKVRQKSKSVADLMVLTHIDVNTVKDIFQEELKKLHEERRESLLFVPVQPSDSIDRLQDVNINHNFTHDKVVENMFSGFSSVNNSRFIDSLESSEPNSLVQDEKSLTEMEASINALFSSAKNESLIKENENKIENNLLRSSDNDKNLVIDPQIITDNKNDSKTVPSVSDSKLEEKLISDPEIKLIESNQIESTTNKSTSQEISSNFDTFLHHAPVLSKIDTIESNETVIKTPESGNKNLDIIDNFNQNILSNEILLVKEGDAPNSVTVVSTPEKSIDYRDKHSQVESKIEEPSLSQTQILEKSHGKPEHIEQVSMKNTNFSVIQDFISNERNAEFLKISKTEESDEKPVQKEAIITEESKSDKIILHKQEKTDENLEPQMKNSQVKEDINKITDNKVEETKPLDVFVTTQENKKLVVGEKLQTDEKQIEEITLSKQNMEVKRVASSQLNTDLHLENNLLKENKELVVSEKTETDEKQINIVNEITFPEQNIGVAETKVASHQINEISEKKTDLHLENKLLEEHKELIVSEKSETDEKQIDIVKEITLPKRNVEVVETKVASPQIREIRDQNTESRLKNKLLEEDKELINSKKSENDEKQIDIIKEITIPEQNIEVVETKVASSQISEICDPKIDLRLENKLLEEHKELIVSKKSENDEKQIDIREINLTEAEVASPQFSEIRDQKTDMRLDNKLLEENKELIVSKKSETDEKQINIVKEILPEQNIVVVETKVDSSQISEICDHNTDLHLENKLLEQNKELMVLEKSKTDEKQIDIVKEITLPEQNIDLHFSDNIIIPQTEGDAKNIAETQTGKETKINSPIKEEIIGTKTNDFLTLELPTTVSLAAENASNYKQLDKSSKNNEEMKKITEDFILRETANFIPESSGNKISDISNDFIEALQLKLEATLANDLILIEENPIIAKDFQQDNTITEEKEIEESIISPLIPELIENTEIQTQIKIPEDLAKNKLQISNKLVDLMQNDETNISINIPPPPEFIEKSKENREIQTKDVQNIQEILAPTENKNVLDQMDYIPIEKKEARIEEIVTIEPKIEEYIEKSEKLTTEKLLSESQYIDPAEEIKNLDINNEQANTKIEDLEIKESDTVIPIETLDTKQNFEILNLEAPILNEKVRREEFSNIHSELNDDLLQESSVILPQTLKQVDPVITVKSDEFSLIQTFINNERNNNHQNIISPEVKPELEVKSQKESEENNTNLPSVSSELTSDLLDTSNVQQINQIFNVFNVTIDHKPSLECFTSPVKNYYARPFDQNEIMTDINSLLESERKKYESKNSVCTSSLQNDFLPFVNGINSELSNKIIEVLHEKEEHEPKKLTENVLDNFKNHKYEEEITNEEINDKTEFKETKKLSEIVLDSFKTNSISEDSGFGSVQCDDKTLNGMKISADSLDDILSNTEDNDEDKIEIISEIKEIQDFTETISEQIPKNVAKITFEDLENSSTSAGHINEQVPKKLSELVQDSINKTFVQNDVYSKKNEEIADSIQNLPDIVLDNLQNKTFVKENIEILINVINDSPSKLLKIGDKFEENSESAIEDKTILNATVDSPRKLSEIVLDSLPCNSPVTSESTDNVSDKTVIEVNKISDNSAENNQICDEVIDKNDSGEYLELSSPNFIPTSTPFKSSLMPKKTEANDSFFSFVSEGDESSDCQTHVILGPCEEYGLGLYSGLKTTFDKFSDDDRPEEELLQFSSNFMPYSEVDTTHNSVDYSLETWDKFLGKSLQDQDSCPSSVFDNFSPKYDSLDVFKGKNKDDVEVKNEELNKTITLTNNKNNETFTIENEALVPDTAMKEDEPNQAETTQSSWEPGEGWFLHPQTEADDLTGQIDISGGDTVDNTYVGFALDEECVNALRNELAAKLPHAQGISHEEPLEPEEWDIEERNEIIVKYNVYATPLSPIPEESCCDDVYCDQIQHRYLDGSDSESDWSEPCLGQTSQLEEDILVVDTETHTALIIESPSLREPQHRHTPSQDSCCSNDTLFNLEDLNYGHSPQHHGSTTSTQPTESSSEQNLEIDIETPKQSPINQIPKIQTEENINSDSTEMNLTYTKPDINIDESENSNHQTILQDSQESKPESLNKLELKLDPNMFGVAPLPSPEDIPWRQLPASLLTYNEVVQNDKYEIQDSEESQADTIENVIDQEDLNLPPENANDDLSDSVRDCTVDTDLYSNLTDIRFSGPCDAQLMSTSFSESADYAEERDWDSGSDTRSSSSGEFIWKEGEHEESLRALHAASHDVGVTEDINPMDAIEEENSNSSEDSDDCEEDMEETEFVPSAWDAQATPTKSALRSPEKSTKRKTQQKGVWFKKQKYHCVYEYPREPESPVAPPSELWRPLSDLSTFADWELDPESCVPPSFEDTTDGGYDVLDKFITRSSYPLSSSRHRDLYHLNPFPDFGAAGLSGSDEDFFISSSARPFQTVGQSSQFFPGQNPPKSKFLWQEYQSSSQQSSRDLSDGITPDSGIDDVTPAGVSESGLIDILPSRTQKVPPLKCLAAIAANKTPPSEQKSVDSSLGGLRHTRNRLKLDLPPSPNSFSSTRTFSIDVCSNDPVINREVPTFTTFGKSRFSVQHVATPTDECPDPLQAGIPKIKNVSFEALPHKPMKLTEKVYILDKSEGERKNNPVEMVQGEASLLDSADEDSGIESSANATLERHQQQILN